VWHAIQNSPWDLILFFLLFGFVIPWRGAVRIRKLLARPSLTLAERIATYASTIVLQWLLAAFIAWRCVARRLSSADLGIEISNGALTAAAAIGLAAFLALLQWLGARRTASTPDIAKHRLAAIALRLMPQETLDSLIFVALCVTAGLCEEFIYRGFLYALIARSLGIVIAFVASSVFFAIAHAYQGRRGMISTFILGLFLCASRIWTGNLLPAVAAHTTVDLVAGLVAVRYIRRAVAASEIAPVSGAAGPWMPLNIILSIL
jgi:uncharacterized protein